jgi:hypothetical protein
MIFVSVDEFDQRQIGVSPHWTSPLAILLIIGLLSLSDATPLVDKQAPNASHIRPRLAGKRFVATSSKKYLNSKKVAEILLNIDKICKSDLSDCGA